MSEPSIVQRLMRERAMWRYITALEDGNLDVIASVVKRAEKDEVLEKMILELHATYQTEEDFLRLFQEEKSMETDDGLHKPGLSGHPFSPAPEPEPKPAKRRQALQTLVAALIAICLVGGILLYSGFQRSPQTARQITSYNWCIVPGSQIDPQKQISYFTDMAAVSSESIWIVGNRDLKNSDKADKVHRFVPQFVHWDGLDWKMVGSADTTQQINDLKQEARGKSILEAGAILNSLAVLSADNIWAVGSVSLTMPRQKSPDPTVIKIGHTLIEHWDGRSWQIVESPESIAPMGYNILNSLVALAPNDIWAAGSANTPGSYDDLLDSTMPLVEHWDGTRWNLVTLPATLQKGSVRSLSASAPDDIWIAGIQTSYALSPRPFIAHWNGQVWSSAPQPLPISSNGFSDVSVLAKNNAWAVGGFSDTQRIASDPPEPSLLAHWDGRSWSGVEGAMVMEPRSGLSSMTTSGPNDIWVVGYVKTAEGIDRPLIEHWDGKNWRVVSARSGPAGVLEKVRVVENHVWVLGETTTRSSNGYDEVTGSLIERSC